MSAGRMFSRGGLIVDFCRSSQKNFSWDGKCGEMSFFPLETKKTTVFAEQFVGKCQFSKSSGDLCPLPCLPTPMPCAIPGYLRPIILALHNHFDCFVLCKGLYLCVWTGSAQVDILASQLPCYYLQTMMLLLKITGVYLCKRKFWWILFSARFQLILFFKEIRFEWGIIGRYVTMLQVHKYALCWLKCYNTVLVKLVMHLWIEVGTS